ncbi:MAG TPA: hypothetical protein VK701_04900, partial [Solirubrobacteraceae bacterium]|nr:hypothetical protein [Solirubrobacteraceae bacterium]
MRLTGWILAILAVACALAPCSFAAESVRFHARLAPKRPGRRTTAEFSIDISAENGGVPPPLTGASVRYPEGLGLALSGLGIDTCSRQTLEADGAAGCPADAFMGNGTATAEIKAEEVVRE